MSSIGGVIGGVVGFIGGIFLGNPLLGFYLGYTVGTMIDPPKVINQKSPLEYQDLTWNTFQRNLPVPIVYGKDRVFGNIMFIGDTHSEVYEHEVDAGGGGSYGGDNTYTVQEIWYFAEFAMCLSEGAINSVSKVWLDDKNITEWEGITYTVYTGTSGQDVSPEADAFFATNKPNWRNTAYLMFAGKIGQINRIPIISAEISNGNDGISSNNPADVIYDLLTNTRYGVAIPSGYIDSDSFQVVREYCDAEVSAGEKRFELDITLASEQPVIDWLQEMLKTFAGYMVITDGKIKLLVDREGEAAVASFSGDNLIADSFSYSYKNLSERFNKVEVEFINREDSYRHDFVVASSEYSQDITGARETVIKLLAIKRKSQAQRMANYYLDYFLNVNFACEFGMDFSNCGIEVGDIIDVAHDDAPWSGDKTFRVLSIQEQEDFTYKVACLQYLTGIHHDGSNTYQETRGTDVSTFLYSTPTHVVDANTYEDSGKIIVTASLAPDPGPYATTLVYKKVDDGDYVYVGSMSMDVPTAYLSGDITADATSIQLTHASGDWANNGTIIIDNEQIYYGVLSDSDALTSCVRGYNSTVAAAHTDYSSEVTTSKVYCEESGSLVDRTTEFADIDQNVPFFASGDDYLYIGAASRFGKINVSLDTFASGDVYVSMSGDYAVGSGDWSQLYFEDDTQGFQRDGCISWKNWQQTTWDVTPITGDVVDRYYIRLTRTTSPNTGDIIPVEKEFSLVVPKIVTNITNKYGFEYDYLNSEVGQTLTFKLIAQSSKSVTADSTTAPTVSIIPSGT